MVNNCHEAIEKVYYFLDGEITWYRRQRIRRHLRRCRTCNGAYEFEAAFLQVVRRKGVEAPPPELIDRLRTFLEEHGDEINPQ